MPRDYFSPHFYGVSDYDLFSEGVYKLMEGLKIPKGLFVGDNLISWSKNLSFLDDPAFTAAVGKQDRTPAERATIWRMAVVAWAAKQGLRREGDFVECACYRGTTARIVCDYIRFADHPDRRYFLYDMFEHGPETKVQEMNDHGSHLFEFVKQRFSDLPTVTVTKGRVPESLAQASPEKIAFMHLDVNNAMAEIGVLDLLFDRMAPGAILILDDYGWMGYRDQKLVEDGWFNERGYEVLELPTGQGIVIK
jgi:hypothetical protein